MREGKFHDEVTSALSIYMLSLKLSKVVSICCLDHSGLNAYLPDLDDSLHYDYLDQALYHAVR